MFGKRINLNDLGKITINLNAIKNNYRIIKKRIGKNCKIASVLKANAYGLGVRKIAKVLDELGCEIYFVATLSEGIELRRISKKSKILVLNGLSSFNADTYKYFKSESLIPVINSLNELKSWIKLESNFNNYRIPIALHFDTGMNRLGIPEFESKKIVKKINEDNLNIYCMMSHLSSADEKNKKINYLQKKIFDSLVHIMPINCLLSIGNSNATFNLVGFNYSFVRSGGALLGINPTSEMNPLKNVVSLHAKVLQIRNLKKEKNKVIGYNSSYRVKDELKIAVLGIGYADGYPRNLSNVGHATFRKKKLPIVGRISMDYLTIDISELSNRELKVGNWVELIGDNISIQKVANDSETIEYEILNNLGNRLQKHYIG